MGNIQSGLQENSFIFLIAIGILIMLALALAFVLYVNNSQKKMLTTEMLVQEQTLAHQEELLHSNIITQEEERKRIAQELHDDIGSKLNVILLNLHQLRKLGSTESMNIHLDEMKTMINKTIATTRRISHDLLPPTLENFGLVEALKELVDGYRNTHSVAINFISPTEIDDSPNEEISLNLYRVIQELLHNTVKHADASVIDIVMSNTQGQLKIHYSDNGKGVSSIAIDKSKGLGMKNIQSRLQMIQAEHVINSAIGKGFDLQIVINLYERQ